MENEYPILEKLKAKQSPYSVPDDYFERLNKQIMDQTKHIQPTAKRKQPLVVRMRPLLYMAAMFAGAFVIIQVATDSDSPNATSNTSIASSTSTTLSVPTQLSSYRSSSYDDNINDYAIASMDEYSLYEYYCETSMTNR